MTERQDDDKWMAALSGRQPAEDADTRSAARLREALLPTPDEEDAGEMDDATLRRMMNRLEAKGAFEDAGPLPVRPAAPKGGWLARIRSAILGDQGWGQLGYAAAALAVVAVMVAPTLRPPGDGPAVEEPVYTKQGGQAGDTTRQRIHAAAPAKAAAELGAALRQQGLDPDVRASAAGQVMVTVQVPAANRPKVASALMDLGLSLPADGWLSVAFVPLDAGQGTQP